MAKIDIATAKFLEGYMCSQAVLYSFCDDLQLEKDIALKVACGFGAGMSCRQEVCGAVTGGIMVLGAKYGRGEKEGRTATESTFAKTRELMRQFADRHGTVICRQLLNGCDLMTPEGQKQYRDNDLLNKSCKGYVQSAVEILERIM